MNYIWQNRRNYLTYFILFGFFTILALWSSGCVTELADKNINPLPEKGQTTFQTDEAADSNRGDGFFGPSSPKGPSLDAGSAAPPTDPNNHTPSGRTGTVKEADLYKSKGNLLFYLNTYKGLTLFDLTERKKPKKLYNLPIYGYPIEMFVEKNIVYALVKDALYLLSINGKFQFKRRYVSQLVTIDISDIKRPKILERFDIKGQLREGVSRKIDNTIYVVSYKPRNYWSGWNYNRPTQNSEQATIYSFNVSDPKAVQLNLFLQQYLSLLSSLLSLIFSSV